MSQDILDNRPGAGRSFFGPLSVLAVAIGLSVSALPWFTDIEGAALAAFLPPLAGSAMIGLRGPVRHFGTGLALSILGAPIFFLFFIVFLNVVHVFS